MAACIVHDGGRYVCQKFVSARRKKETKWRDTLAIVLTGTRKRIYPITPLPKL
jgi:hypothetical protein